MSPAPKNLLIEINGVTRLRGRANYCFWRREMIRIFENHRLEAFIAQGDIPGHKNRPDDVGLICLSTMIRSTFSEDLKSRFHIWAGLAIDSRRLWRELQDRFEAKGKWAYIMLSIQLKRTQREEYADLAALLLKQQSIVLQRSDTGIEMTSDIREMVKIAEGVPKRLRYLHLKWCVAEEGDLTPDKMKAEISKAEQRLQEDGEKTGAQMSLSYVLR
ncbi:hypothetical protein WAI453_002555 [Rhynchosporium graminicola]